MISLPRRAVPVLLAGAAIALAGCDLLPATDPAEPPAPTADELLVGSVAAAVLTARDLAASRPGGLPYAALHEAHLAALGRPVTSTSPVSPASTPTPMPAQADLVATEQALQTTLVEAAVGAEDGELARLLASMSAAVAQQLNGAAA